MRGEKLRVWFAPEDRQGGQKLIEPIDRAIQVNDRLLLVLSEHSLNSEWVQTEIRKARQAELREQRQKLFPIRLVSIDRILAWSCFDADTGKDLAVELREYHIPDFSNWKTTTPSRPPSLTCSAIYERRRQGSRLAQRSAGSPDPAAGLGRRSNVCEPFGFPVAERQGYIERSTSEPRRKQHENHAHRSHPAHRSHRRRRLASGA